MRRESTKRKERKRPESFYQEVVKKYISKKYDCVAVRELNFGGPKFDVVGFSPNTNEFHIVECKRTSRPAGVGQTFGQILAYQAMIFDAGERFLNSFEKHLSKDRITKIAFWQHAHTFVEARKIPIRFYVALLEKACSKPEFLRLMKRDLKKVGIIRINKDGKCKDYIRIRGDKDHGLCKAERINIPIATPARTALRKVLDRLGVEPDIGELAATIDFRLMKMSRRMKSVPHGSHALFYRVERNFVGVMPKKQFVRIKIREKSGWNVFRVKRNGQLSTILKRVRKALDRSLSST
jgi:hypothetical protein